MSGSVIVVCGGKVGRYLATLLQESGLAVKIIEARPEDSQHDCAASEF